MDDIKQLGWSDFFEKEFLSQYSKDVFDIGRVGIEYNSYYRVHTRFGERLGEVTGKLMFQIEEKAQLPKVGDWVVITHLPAEEKCVIHDVLPRRTVLSRKFAGNRTEEQLIAVNLDVVFIVQGLDLNYNLRRIERYLPMIYEGGMTPVVILNKTDLCDHVEKIVEDVSQIARNVPIVTVSCLKLEGLEQIRQLLKQGQTYAFIGSSGVGKSSIVNALFGEAIQETFDVREDDSKGRHITTRRELLVFPEGGILIDTPGMRELQIWDVEDGIKETFNDIEMLSEACHFTDCKHIDEIKCAVKNAVDSGSLSSARYTNYLKMLREQQHLESKLSDRQMIQEKLRKKKVQKGWRNTAREIRNKKQR